MQNIHIFSEEKVKLLRELLRVSSMQREVIQREDMQELSVLIEQKQRLMEQIDAIDRECVGCKTVHGGELSALLKDISALEEQNKRLLSEHMQKVLDKINNLRLGKKSFNAYNKNIIYR